MLKENIDTIVSTYCASGQGFQTGLDPKLGARSFSLSYSHGVWEVKASDLTSLYRAVTQATKWDQKGLLYENKGTHQLAYPLCALWLEEEISEEKALEIIAKGWRSVVIPHTYARQLPGLEVFVATQDQKNLDSFDGVLWKASEDLYDDQMTIAEHAVREMQQLRTLLPKEIPLLYLLSNVKKQFQPCALHAPPNTTLLIESAEELNSLLAQEFHPITAPFALVTATPPSLSPSRHALAGAVVRISSLETIPDASSFWRINFRSIEGKQ